MELTDYNIETNRSDATEHSLIGYLICILFQKVSISPWRMLVQCRITLGVIFAILSTSTHSYTEAKSGTLRGTVRAKCVSLEDNTVTLLAPGLFDPESSLIVDVILL